MEIEIQVTQQDIDKFFKCFKKHDYMRQIEANVLRKKYMKKYVDLYGVGYPNKTSFTIFGYDGQKKDCHSKIEIMEHEQLREDRAFVNAMMRRIPYDPNPVIILDVYNKYKEIKDYLTPFKFKTIIPDGIKNNEKIFKTDCFWG